MLGVPLRPSVCSRFHAEVVSGDAVAFVGENGSAIVRDPVAQHVVPLIDGIRTSEEIERTLGPRFAARQVHAALAAMTRAGLVVEAGGVPTQVAALWAELGVPEFRVRRLLDALTVGIQPLTSAPLWPLWEALGDLGFTIAPAPGACDLTVVIVDDYLDPRLAEIDRHARMTGQPWLPVKPAGVNVWVGPAFVPGVTACWNCLADRLRGNRPVDDYLHRQRGRRVPLPVSRARSRMAAQHAYSMLATQLARWVSGTGGQPPVDSTLVVLETLRLVPSWHSVKRRPQCPACGDPALAVPAVAPPDLHGAPAPVASTDGGERGEPPEATFDRYRHLISPVTGVVSDVVPSPWNSASPLRSYTAGLNRALMSDTLQIAGDSLRTQCSGKGRSDAQARTSALCEAVERASGVHTGEEPRAQGALADLGDAALDPRDCMLFSERQYRERDRQLGSGGGFHMVPNRFESDTMLEWSPVWSLTETRTRYLPTSYLYYGYPRDRLRFVAWADSNGCAAGTTLAEACLQGLYELIERDSVAIWWYNRIRRPGVDISGLDTEWVAQLRSFYERIDREFWLLDITADLAVPAFAALSRRVHGPTEDIVIGFGAHHDPSIAASRALTEMNQFMPAVLEVSDDGTTRYGINDPEMLRWWTTAHLDDQPYLIPLASAPPTDLRATCRPDSSTAAQTHFRTAVDSLEARGLEVLVLDQTRPDIGLPVVKVIVPGVRHFWARFAPGRLYDVPVELGWVAEPIPEEQLNPIAMFI